MQKTHTTNKIEETGQQARQGEVSPRWPILKVLVISTIIAGTVLFLAATFMI
jgi:hypothetical protein